MTRIVPVPKWADVFVFGSNWNGYHGAGSALEAYKWWGAKWGVGVGPQGKSYAIPTKGYDLRKSLAIEDIRPYVDLFIYYANEHKDKKFWIVQIGCGLAGYTVKQMKPLFEDAPKNCFFAWDEEV